MRSLDLKPDAKKVLILSPFPPTHGKVAARGAALAHAFDAAGAHVTTLDAPATSYAAQHMHFAPKRRYLREAEAVLATRWDCALLAPATLEYPRIHEKTLKKRGAVMLRHIGFFWRLGRQARQVIIVRGGRHAPSRWLFWAVSLALLARRPGSVTITKASDPIALARRATGANLPPSLDDSDGDETLLRLAGAGLRHGPAWFRRAIHAAPQEVQTRLLPVLAACQRHARKCAAPFAKSPIARQSAQSPAAMAQLLHSEDDPIPALALHLRSHFRAQNRFHLGTKLGRARLLHWYVNQGPELLGAALPLPADALSAFHRQISAPAAPGDLCADLQAFFHKLGDQLGPADADGQLARDFETLIYLARFTHDLATVAPDVTTRFATLMPGGRLTLFQLMAAVLGHAPAAEESDLIAPWSQQAIADWFDAHVVAQAPALQVFSTVAPTSAPATFYLTGPEGGTSGLATNRAMSERALAGVTVNRAVALHHVNADAIPGQILRHGTGAAFNIGFLLWETDCIPINHHFANDLLDAIWAPSRFVADVYARAFDREVTWVGKAVDLPPIAPPSRAAFGLADHHHVVLSVFDAHSSVVRKNPLATLRAFQQAFDGDKDARLIIKTTPLPADHWGDPERQMDAIASIAAQDSRISIDTRHLPFADLLGLIACADCLASSHRGEGFGYIPAYALALGTPVVATDYSGTQDFISAKTGWPVRWVPRDIRPGETILPLQAGHWAEVDIGAMAEAMHNVRSNPDDAAQRTAAGKALIAQHYSIAAQTDRYRKALGALGLLTECSPNVHVSHGHRTDREGAAAHAGPASGARRVPASAKP